MTKAFTYFAYFTLVALGLMGGLDLLFFIWGGAGQTLSYQFWKFSIQYPVIPFALGFLCGHLVWQYNPSTIKIQE